MNIRIEIIDTQHPLYEQEKSLRDEVLRKPIGQSIADDDLQDEVNQVHFAALFGEELVGVVVLKKESKTGKLRQMAVKPEMQGKQLGKTLVEALENHAKNLGLKEISLHARHYAVGFYEKLNYAKTDLPSFIEVGMPHFEMKKIL